ncbi:MAG: class I SAM-dependent methyltransferase [Chloroflexi bacterium]|nr:MAG: class I SAM-dependent methyltransferase [Chloroflexota bacterium]
MAKHPPLSAYPPDGFERRLIERFVSLRRKRVLEVGCGDGRLTLQYGGSASSVLAIDPDPVSIDEAVWQQAARGINTIDFRVGSIEGLPERGAPFDVALFSWSL